MTPAGARFGKIELPFVVIVFFASVLGLIVSPLWLAAGYFLHGAWDVLHHVKRVTTPIVPWFPPLCAVFDLVVGAFIVSTWWLAAT